MLESSAPLRAQELKPDTGTQVQKPLTVLRAGSRWNAINLRLLWHYRDLLLTLALRDLKLRHRQTALGVLWVVLQPLLGAGILTFVFHTVARVPSGDVPPFLLSFIGISGFTLFSNTLSRSSVSLVQNSHLVSKVFFPRLILPLSVVPSALLDFGVSLSVTVVLMIAYGITPTLALLSLPLWLFLIVSLALGCGLLAATLTVSYRDVQYILPVFLSFLTFASPVAYPLSLVANNVPHRLIGSYFLLNPFAVLLEALRWSLVGSNALQWNYIVYSSLLAMVMVVVGALSFHRCEKSFADVI